MQTPVQLIVGLGNPGPEYQHTRHNAGEDFVRRLADQCHQPLAPTAKFFGDCARINIGGRDVRVLVPSTYMNRSGQAVGAMAQFFKIPVDAILVAHDELDLPPGTARLKRGGGHGGHNGLRDIMAALGNDRNFARLRLGIGHPGNAKMVTQYVLKKAPKAERERADDAAVKAIEVLPHCLSGDWERAMHLLHTEL